MLKEAFADFWTYVKGWNITTAFTALVYAAILALFLVAYFKCVSPVRYCRGKLRRAVRDVKHNAAEQPWQDKYFLGKGALFSVWCEYLNSRNFADNNYHNASPLEDYINEDTVINEPGRVAFSDAVPGLMVSLGFLGTLIGLMMGLADFNMTNTDTTMNAIRQLVGGMRYAFATSIVGVVASILYQLLARASHDAARGAISAFLEIMHRQAGVQAVDPLTQITIYQQEQTALIQTVAEDITGAMTDRIGAAIEMALQPVQSSLDDFVRATSREQARAIDEMARRFVENLDATLSHQVSNLASTLSETCKWQRETREAVGDVMAGMQRVTSDIMQIEQMSESLIVKFDGYMNRLGAGQLQLDDGYAAVASASRAMDASAKQQFECIAQMTELQGELTKSLDAFRADAEKFELSLSDAGDASAASLQKASDELKLNSEVLNDAHKTFIRGVNKELEHTFDLFDAHLTDITKQLGEVIEGIRASVSDLPAAVQDAGDLYQNQLTALTAVLQNARRDFEDAMRNRP